MESLSDIVAQMRGRGEDGRMDRHLWNEYADRIEAAAKRVVVSKTETTTVGNTAALRDALESVSALIADEPDGTPMIDEMKATIEVALAAPPRNCDRFQVAAEALQEWQSLVKAKPNTWDFRYNYWLFAPAAEEGAGK